jgi:hypothetical protein
LIYDYSGRLVAILSAQEFFSQMKRRERSLPHGVLFVQMRRQDRVSGNFKFINP